MLGEMVDVKLREEKSSLVTAVHCVNQLRIQTPSTISLKRRVCGESRKGIG